MNLMPTPRDTVFTDGPAELFRFRLPEGVAPDTQAPPVLLVPSMINRWYVLDLRANCSVAEGLTKTGLDTWLLNWGAPNDEDRYFSWNDAVNRLDRMMRRVMRETGQKKVTVLGYCMGATLSSVHAALHPEMYAGFVNLLGPIDFTESGMLGRMTHPDWFDGHAVGDAGNVSAQQMQSGFTLLRPTSQISKWVGLADKAFDPAFRESFQALETWSNDNVAFPGEAYKTYIKEIYQENQLIKGQHAVAGKRVDLKKITCPLMTVSAAKDTICPPKAATALNHAVGSTSSKVLEVPGGHVGAVVGSKASQSLYPALAAWMKERTCN